MPDAGISDHHDHGHHLPQDWAGAFAALPQEAPSADGWQRLQARLPAATAARAPHRRVRWPLWLAAAASLALAVAIPLRMQPEATPGPLAMTPAADLAATPPAPNAGTDIASRPVATAPIEIERATATTVGVDKPRPGKMVKPSQRPIRTVAQPADATRIAASDATTPAAAPSVEAPSLEPLYARSAQLEGLLALARDDRVSNGTAAAMSDNLDTRVASIDAALARADVTPERRSQLWRDRIDVLRQLVGIETTQRLYSARGQQYDAALVSID